MKRGGRELSKRKLTLRFRVWGNHSFGKPLQRLCWGYRRREEKDCAARTSAALAFLSATHLKVYSPPEVDRTWLWVYYNKIPRYPIFYLLKGSYRTFRVPFQGFSKSTVLYGAPMVPSQSRYGNFPRLGVPFKSTHNKDYSILGSILGPLILGNYHFSLQEGFSGAIFSAFTCLRLKHLQPAPCTLQGPITRYIPHATTPIPRPHTV